MNRLRLRLRAAGGQGLVHTGVGDGGLARPAVEPAVIGAQEA